MRYLSLLIVYMLIGVSLAGAASMATYTWQPPVVTDSSIPNVMILFSNDWTAFTQGYPHEPNYNDEKDYGGYFDSRKYYEVKTTGKAGEFRPVGWLDLGDAQNPKHLVPSAAGSNYWSGNFLNWATMANVDFLRSALTGGSRQDDSVGHTVLRRGYVEVPPANPPADYVEKVWKKPGLGTDPSKNFNRLVPSAYALDNVFFYNYGNSFEVRQTDASGTSETIIGGPFTVDVLVCVQGMLEGNCTDYPGVGEAKPQGLLHRYGDKMRFALMSYSHGSPTQGGVLRKKMGYVNNEWSWNNGQQNQDNSDVIIRYIENYTAKEWDPLGEMFFEAIRYYKFNQGASAAYCQDVKNGTSDDGFDVYGCASNKDWGDDPIQDWCQKNNILIMSDEYPAQDHDAIPGSYLNPGYSVTEVISDGNNYEPDVGALTDAIGDHERSSDPTAEWHVGYIEGSTDPTSLPDCANPKTVGNLGLAHGICPNLSEAAYEKKGTFHLAGLAYDAFTSDLRPNMEGIQNVKTWVVAFRATADGNYQEPDPPMNPLWLAAKYGNFDDLPDAAGIKNGLPDDGEWAREDGTNTPRAFFAPENPTELEEAIGAAFEAILETTASSTAVSVLANSGQGEGNLVQAYYRPRLRSGDTVVDWIGFLQSLWIDSAGRIREDTNQDLILDDNDLTVRYVEADGTTKAIIGDGTVDDAIDLTDVNVLWDAGEQLASRTPDKRRIFTYLKKNGDDAVDDTIEGSFDDSGEVVAFDFTNYLQIRPYLDLNSSDYDYLGRVDKTRVRNLIAWIRGYDPLKDPIRFRDLSLLGIRSRADLDANKVYKLGDIINSTPVTVAAPPDSYHIIYGDPTYQEYFNKYEDRATMVYVGANDGMMHAIYAGHFDKENLKFEDKVTSVDATVGDELWAYIPQNLLPHLKWIPNENYDHVYYVDMQPRIFDARIFYDGNTIINETKHPKGWGTILIGGFGIGGGRIVVNHMFGDADNNYTYETRTFKPSYFAIDITDPVNPELLWERTYDQLGMSYSYPTVVRREAATHSRGEWYLVFGSGPDAGDRTMSTPQYDAESADPGYLYVVDLLTGEPYRPTATGTDYLFSTVASGKDNAYMTSPVSFDKDLNYNVDAVYVPMTYDNGSTANHDWKGGIYKITIPWVGPSTAPYGSTDDYKGPIDSTNPWQFHLLFDSPRPITAAPALSIDSFDNTWVYFGTGRMFTGDDDTNSDFGSEEAEYLFGIKDPFFSRSYNGTYYLNYTMNKTVVDLDTDPTELFDSDLYLVLTTGDVYKYNNATLKYDSYGYFSKMLDDARQYDGWQRTLREELEGSTVRKMRSLNKPSVIGGLSLFTTFMPSGATCGFGGESDLNILYYETGTAYRRVIAQADGATAFFDLNNDGIDETEIIKESISLGSGSTSSVGIHIGRQNDSYSQSGDNPEGDILTGFVQQGTGTVVKLDLETAFKVRSGLRSWLQN